MSLEFRVLGPLEALVGGVPARLGGPRQRALLAILLVHAERGRAGRAAGGRGLGRRSAGHRGQRAADLRVAAAQGPGPRCDRDPRTRLRRRGRRRRAGPGGLRTPRERRGAGAGRRALWRRGEEFRAALALWRGPALSDLADEPCARTVAARLDELRVVALGACDRRGSRVWARRRAGGRARCAGRRGIRCTSAFGRSRWWRCIAVDARPTRSRPSSPRAGRWSRSSASSRALLCATSSARFSSRIRRSPPRARRRRQPRRSPTIRVVS